MKKALIYIVLLCCGLVAKAQQLPQYSQYILNKYVINPASAGSEGYYVGQTNYRSQWEGIKDAPTTYILSANGPLAHQKMGIGGYLMVDVTGPTRRTAFNLSYAYHVNITSSLKLSMAVNAGILNYSIDGSEIVFENPADYTASNYKESKMFPDAGFSFYLYDDNLFFGGSAPQLIQNELDFQRSIADPSGRLVNHYFLLGGYKIDASTNVQVEPSFLLKYIKPIPIQYELSLRGIYKEVFYIGGSYREGDAIALLAGYTLQNNLTLGYSYDIVQSDIQNYSTGTHEIMLSFKFNNKPVFKGTD